MKGQTRLLSLLLAAILLLSLAPPVTLPASAATDPPVVSLKTADDDTDITIDFDYERDHNVKSREAALELTADGQFIATQGANLNALESLFTQTINGDALNLKWQKAAMWTVQDHDTRSLRELLCSTDPEDMYIALNQDDDHNFTSNYEWVTMEIRSDKVLDLNGHQIKIRYDSNRDSDRAQRDEIEYHNCVAFRILDGATLTIIDSSAWRGENNGEGTGLIAFSGWRVNPFKHKINTYTTRDLFDVANGNLVIYGGHFQAGNQKTFYKDNFSWSKLRACIGTAVELGVSVAEYATGIDAASSAYKDLLGSEKSPDLSGSHTDSSDDDDGSSGPNMTKKKDGSDAPKEDAKDSPAGEGKGLKSVDEKQAGKTDGDKNKANEKKTGKDDSNTKAAEGRKKIVESAVNKKGITGMVDKVFALGESIAGMIGKDKDSFVVEYIMGTVVKVGSGSTFVAYGGHYEGYGSTPNTRNAVVEVVYWPDTHMPFDSSKNQGGLVYIYDGVFEGYGGANIFNFVRSVEGNQQASQIIVEADGSRPTEVVDGETVDKKSAVTLNEAETGGVEILYYDNQEEAGTEGFVPKLINTANVQVRGGVFRNHYETQNVSIRQPNDKDNFTRFPGTNGWVNLGIESYGEDLIRDGRIQIVDKYHDGALVLLDRQTEEKEEAEAAGEDYTEGLYRYRLLCGDLELRYKSYLEVYPNNDAKTNASKSMMLATYTGTGKPESLVWANDDDNIRAAASQTENYFDFVYDRSDAENYYIMPRFHDPNTESQSTLYPEFSKWTDSLDASELWYYPTPRYQNGDKLEATPFAEAWYAGFRKNSDEIISVSQMTCGDKIYAYGKDPDPDNPFPQDGWWWYGVNEWTQMVNNIQNPLFWFYFNYDIKTTQRYFTYKVYRVDPLSRQNIVESGVYGEDSPLISVKYGASDDSLKCKLPLLQVEQQIKQRQIEDGVPEDERWQGFQAGELYRVVLTVEEDVAFGHNIKNGTRVETFGGQLDTATCTSTILFRCVSSTEKKPNTTGTDPHWDYDYTALQFDGPVDGGDYAKVDLVNGMAGMTDFQGVNKVFDVYYQWYEVNADGSNPRLIAGTTNVLNPITQEARGNHHPDVWMPDQDTYQYANTVNPYDPDAASYTFHGLPGDANGNPLNAYWTNRQLHMYSAQTTPQDWLKLGPGNLSPRNNYVFATNFDTCYIPKSMSGKYLQVKAIVLCPEWGEYFDRKQTFTSHVIQVDAAKTVGGTVELDKEGTVLYGTRITASLTGDLIYVPAAARHMQWQTAVVGTENYQDVAGATGFAFTVPEDPGHRKIKVRLKITVDGYPDPVYSKIVFADILYPLSVEDYTFEKKSMYDADADSVDLSTLVSGGSGNFVMLCDSNPEWAYLSGYWVVYDRPSGTEGGSVKVKVVDITTGEEKYITVSIPTYKPKTGYMYLVGTPRYSGDPDNPNILTATTINTNFTAPFYIWKRDGKQISFGTNNTYAIQQSDVGCTISCQLLDWNNGPTDYPENWYDEKVIGLMDGPAAPEVRGGPPSNEDGSNGYITVVNGTYPLELSKYPSFSTVEQTIYEGNFYWVPAGTWYVRSMKFNSHEAGAAATVVVPDHSDYVHFENISKIPYGKGGEEYFMYFNVAGGRMPYTVQIYSVNFFCGLPYTFGYDDILNYGNVLVNYDLEEGQSWTTCDKFYIHGWFPQFIPDTYTEAWSNRGRAELKVTDADGNTAYQQIDFDGFCGYGSHVAFFTPFFTDQTFHDVYYGYEAMGIYEGPLITWAYTDKDWVPCDAISFALEGPDADKFDLSWTFQDYEPGTLLKPAEARYVFVTPKPGLPAGTYQAEVHVHNSQYENEFWYDGNYGTVTFNVLPLNIEDCTVSGIVNKTYTGSPITQDVVVTAPNGQILTEGVDYEVTYEYNITGGYGSLRRARCNITGTGNVVGSASKLFKIEKAVTSERSIDLYIRDTDIFRQTVDINYLLPDKCGSITTMTVAYKYNDGDPNEFIDPEETTYDKEHGIFTFLPSGYAGVGDECYFGVYIITEQYEGFSIKVNVHFTDRYMPAVTMDELTVTYTGQPLAASKIPGTASFGSQILTGTWSFAEPDSPLLKNAHEAADIPVVFTPDDTDTYMEASATFKLTIEPAPVTGQPGFTPITHSGKTLADSKLRVAGGTFPVPGYVYYDLPETTKVKPNQAYTWYFVPSSGNYTFTTGTIVPFPAENPFVDVKAGKFYYDPVFWAYYHDPQVTTGTDETHFSPNKTCTRGQVVSFLWRAMGCPKPHITTHPFTDVKETAYYYKAMLWAYEKGVTNGTDATHFGPNKECTRAQVVTFIWNAFGKPEPGSGANPFADVQEGKFYYKAVLWAVEKGITNGTDATHFSPNKTCTRGQVVTFLYNAFAK